jgi:single-stranded-DNA-specific exonuclease RecJ
MQGMREAVNLITKARDERWRVVVFGDYDADGVCASTIMSNALKDFGITPATVYIPERSEGYGLNSTAIEKLFADYSPNLFITVDCGISCSEEVEHIKKLGAEVIITDHHELPEEIPDCICVNPKFKDEYIYDNLCGAGVALKVAVALNGDESLKYLDFTAIATVADSVPLTGENRDIVYEGLKLINKKPRNCYASFLAKSQGDVNSQTLAFTIAPRINAAGRMGDANSALKLFKSSDDNEIFDLSSRLTAYNQERQTCCDELYQSAKEMLRGKGVYGRVIMLCGENWNTGFVGIVAARLTEEYSRPALLFVKKGDKLKGSARSIENVNIFEALRACSNFIDEFGGHAQAAGVNISEENFDKLENALNDYLTATYSSTDFQPTLTINGMLSGQYSDRFAKEIELLEPFGVGNRRPLFCVEEESVEVRPVKPLSPHISIKSSKIDMMYFSGSKFLKLMESGAKLKYIFEYNVSTFRGREYVKGFVRDIVYGRDCAKNIESDIAVNNVLSLKYPKVDCNISYVNIADIEKIALTSSDYGTAFVAFEYSTIERYKNLSSFPVELFNFSSSNPITSIILSPDSDVDFSAYNKVVFLDNPPFIYLSSLKGKNVIICSEICGYNYIDALPRTRERLLDIFAQVAYNAPKIVGDDSGKVALKNKWTYPPVAIAYALEVFCQLSLVSYEDGRLVLHRGIKTDLTNSQLFNMVSKL